MSVLEQYLADNNYLDKGDYWQHDKTYIQYDDLVAKVTVGKNFQYIPMSLIEAFPQHLPLRIKAVEDMQ